MHMANVVLQKWNKKPYMSSTGKKKQTNKQTRAWECGEMGGGGGA